MKLISVPTSLIEGFLALGNRLPTPIAETFGAMMLARSIEGANNLGVFNFLGQHGPSSASRICEALHLNEQIVGALLHALEGAGYLELEGDRYRNSPISARFLVEGSPQYVGNFVRYNEQQRMIWLGLEHIARHRDRRVTLQEVLLDMKTELEAQLPAQTDEAVYNVHHGLKSKQIWHNYMYGLRDMANLSVPELQLYLRFPRGVTRLLDVGGGHGAYSVWMCKRYPRLKATIFDLEGAAEVGREIVAREGLSDRIEYITGDIVAREGFGTQEYDVAFSFNLIHHLKPDENVQMLRKVGRALKTGGSLVLWDEFRDNKLKEDDFARFIGVMFLLASGGDTYSFEEVTGWMQQEGFHKVKRFSMKSAPGTGMLWGKKA